MKDERLLWVQKTKKETDCFLKHCLKKSILFLGLFSTVAAGAPPPPSS